jgi:tetratricopeptide (TPR) repeat protein
MRISRAILRCASALHLVQSDASGDLPRPEQIKGDQPLNQIVITRVKQLESGQLNPQHFIILGHCYLLLNDFPNAFAPDANVTRIGVRVEDPCFWYGTGCVCHHFNYNANANRYMKQALQHWTPIPRKADLVLRLGINERALGEDDNSIAAFESLVEMPPKGLTGDDIRFHIAFSHQLAGHKDRASGCHHELYNRHRKCLPVIQQYCWFLSLRFDAPSLDLAAQIVHAVGTDDPILKLVSAQLAMKQQDLQAACDRYGECIAEWNDSPLFSCKLGVLYFKNGQMNDAIVAFQRALCVKVEVFEAWAPRGLTFDIQGETDQAIKIYESGMQNYPDAKQLGERLKLLAGGRGRTMQAVLEIND